MKDFSPFERGRRDRAGFTLMETLAATAVIIILLAVSLAGIVTYRRYLKITELDNAAREIYMAAQNRAVLLRNRDRLADLSRDADDGNKLTAAPDLYYYYRRSTYAAMDELLPAGTIDPALWDGDFYVVYEPDSGSVTDVFYAEKDFTDDFAGFYALYRNSDRRARMRLNPMVGYYNGDPGASGDTITLRTPVINIINEDTLTAEVTWWVPQSVSDADGDIRLTLTLEYGEQGKERTVVFDDRLQDRIHTEASRDHQWITHTATYLLDSLVEGQQFRDLGAFTSEGAWDPEFELGQDFTLTAEVRYVPAGEKKYRISGAVKEASDNSLFAKETTEDTAYIGYMRHLQNLHPGFSGIRAAGSMKTGALQIADIGNPLVPSAAGEAEPYHFQPIVNLSLTEYAGQKYEIRDLLVTEGDPAGLFGMFYLGRLEGIRLVNASVTGTDAAGALCGIAEEVDVQDCRVYCEIDEEDETDLRYLLGSTGKEQYYQFGTDTYRVSGGTAGGMIGVAGNAAFTGCLAATTVSGSSEAGGLIGHGSGVRIDSSYADCYVDAPAASGMIGKLAGEENMISGSYSAGFISSGEGESAAGLYLSDDGGSAAVSGSYAAVGYSSLDASAGTAGNLYLKRYPLGENGTYEDTHYLYTAYVNPGTEGTDAWHGLEATYEQLSDAGNIGELFGGGFVMKNSAQTHPYGLQEELSLSRYSYPAIAGMDHYGDWNMEFQVGSLVYWERYADDASGTVGVDGAGVRTLLNEGYVSMDGYAVTLSKDDLGGGTVQITYTAEGMDPVTAEYSMPGAPGGGITDPGKLILIPVTLTLEGEEKETYYLAPLPDALVNTSYAAPDFYQKITVTIGISGEPSEYYYNPHFAGTALEADEWGCREIDSSKQGPV